MRYVFVLLTFFSIGKGFAQTDSVAIRPEKWQYSFSVRSGTLVGCRDCSYQNQITFSATTIHGVLINNKWGLGLGTGFNSFSEWQTLPAFLSTSVNWGKKSQFFIEFNSGYSKAWPGVVASREYGYQKTRGGAMMQPAIGFKLAYHDLRVYFLVGYHFQQVTSMYEYSNQPWSSFRSFQPEPNTRETTYQFNRLLIQMGVGWK